MTPDKSPPTWMQALFLLFLNSLLHIGVLANPGFFSHDEWDKVDHVQTHGLWHFIVAYGQVQAGVEFGFPVRPLGFIQQGITSLWMSSAPLLTHGFDVLLHGVIAVLLFLALRAQGVRGAAPMLAGLIYAASPLTTGAVGWMAASFDQWWTLFTLLAVWAAVSLLRQGLSVGAGLGLLLSAGAAILSKEASLVLPGIVAVSLLIVHRLDGGTVWPLGRIAVITLLCTLPLLAYMAIRLPALEATLAGRAHAAYTPSTGAMAANAWAYFVFPFLPIRGEMRAPVPLDLPALLAAGLHLALIAGVVRYVGWVAAAGYLVLYFLVVALVLPLPQPAAHYVHGSALPFSVAAAAVVAGAWRARHRVALLIAAIGLIASLAQLWLIQLRYYRDGVCQAEFAASLAARVAAPDITAGLFVLDPDPRGRHWTMRRYLHDRLAYDGQAGRPLVRFAEDAPAGRPAVARLTVTRGCSVR